MRRENDTAADLAKPQTIVHVEIGGLEMMLVEAVQTREAAPRRQHAGGRYAADLVGDFEPSRVTLIIAVSIAKPVGDRETWSKDEPRRSHEAIRPRDERTDRADIPFDGAAQHFLEPARRLGHDSWPEKEQVLVPCQRGGAVEETGLVEPT